MALYYDLPVYREVYRLILLVFEYERDFPRDYNFSLGQDLLRRGSNGAWPERALRFTSAPARLRSAGLRRRTTGAPLRTILTTRGTRTSPRAIRTPTTRTTPIVSVRTASPAEFELDYEHNLIRLWEEINGGAYELEPSVALVVERPVEREVLAARFRDRVVHHLIVNKINHLLEREFIFDSYACRLGKGTHFGSRRVHRFIRRCSAGFSRDAYILKLDIRGFFMSIDRELLFRRLTQFLRQRYSQPDSESVPEPCRKTILARSNIQLPNPRRTRGVERPPAGQKPLLHRCRLRPAYRQFHQSTLRQLLSQLLRPLREAHPLTTEVTARSIRPRMAAVPVSRDSSGCG